jgi:hypothetical protein
MEKNIIKKKQRKCAQGVILLNAYRALGSNLCRDIDYSFRLKCFVVFLYPSRGISWQYLDCVGARGTVMVKALYYKTEGRRFDTR